MWKLALVGVGGLLHHVGLHSAFLPHRVGDLHVAFHAVLFPGPDSQRMTARALRRSAQGLMSFGERPRGKLCVQW